MATLLELVERFDMQALLSESVGGYAYSQINLTPDSGVWVEYGYSSYSNAYLWWAGSFAHQENRNESVFHDTEMKKSLEKALEELKKLLC